MSGSCVRIHCIVLYTWYQCSGEHQWMTNLLYRARNNVYYNKVWFNLEYVVMRAYQDLHLAKYLNNKYV